MKNYLIIEDNIVTNVCLWDGDVNKWTPPNNAIVLEQETTPSRIWSLVNSEYELLDTVGDGAIGFTYDGTRCITHEEKPENPNIIPVTIAE
jgi:hypothetical protein